MKNIQVKQVEVILLSVVLQIRSEVGYALPQTWTLYLDMGRTQAHCEASKCFIANVFQIKDGENLSHI